MASQALYLKWRPMTFDEVVGQEHVTSTLRNALASGRVAHAYLFSGPRGTGKTTTARLLAKAVNCLHEDPANRPDNTCAYCTAVNEGRFLDMIEIDAASHTGVDDVRELRDRIAFAPNEGRYKVYIIDEVHRFSGPAFDALLKTIEEPPAHAIFVLATTEIHKVPQTILSRCQRFDFRRIPIQQVVERLRLMVDSEGLQADNAALELIARQGTGSLRDSISLLDQLIAQPEDVLTLELVQAVMGTVANEAVQDLLAYIIFGDTAAGIDLINQVMDEGGDARQFARQMVDYLRVVMLVQAGGADSAASLVTRSVLDAAAEHAGQVPRRILLETLKAFNQAVEEARIGWQPQLPLEMAFLESIDAMYAPEQGAVSPPAPAHQPSLPAETPPPAENPPAPQPESAEEDHVEEPVNAPPVIAEISFEEVLKHWREVLAIARKTDKAVEALLNSGKPYDVEGDTILFQTSDFVCGKIEAEQNREIIEQALSQVYQKPLKIRCQARKGKVRQQSDKIEDRLAQDKVASYAVNELGGSVKRIEDTRSE